MSRTHSYRFKILEHHLDTFGHVNNATYLALFEEARWDFITENGYGMDTVHKLRQSPIIMNVDMAFKAEVLNREDVVIETVLLDYKGKVGRLKQSLLKSGSVCACEAVFVFGLFDLASRKLILPTESWKKAIGLGEASV